MCVDVFFLPREVRFCSTSVFTSKTPGTNLNCTAAYPLYFSYFSQYFLKQYITLGTQVNRLDCTAMPVV